MANNKKTRVVKAFIDKVAVQRKNVETRLYLTEEEYQEFKKMSPARQSEWVRSEGFILFDDDTQNIAVGVDEETMETMSGMTGDELEDFVADTLADAIEAAIEEHAPELLVGDVEDGTMEEIDITEEDAEYLDYLEEVGLDEVSPARLRESNLEFKRPKLTEQDVEGYLDDQLAKYSKEVLDRINRDLGKRKDEDD